MRAIQHKREAYWFYRFLSIFYDRYVNPLFWTPEMRSEALLLAELNSPELLTLEVGSGTGFTTLGIIQKINPSNVVSLDQSPHQMAKAQRKPALSDCTFQIGDAENLPFPDNHFDRYISAGSIEYWPNPQKGISEAYRVLKPGGVALIIGPLHPQNWFARKLADTWMLFPEEEDYVGWFESAGFEQLKTKYIKPPWIRNEKYGLAVSGMKPRRKPESIGKNLNQQMESEDHSSFWRTLRLIGRLMIGSVAGFVFIPIALAGTACRFVVNKFGVRSTAN